MPLHRVLRAAALLWAGALALPAPGSAQSAAGRAPVSERLALATFDTAWNRIRVTHYDSLMRGLDWHAVRDSLRPRAARARTQGDLRQTITAMLDALGESHFVLIPREAADAVDPDRAREAPASDAPGDVGITLRLIGDTVVVARVAATSPAERAGVRAGWIVDSVGRFSAARARQALSRLSPGERQQMAYMIPRSAMAQFAGAAGAPVHAVFTDERGRTAALRIERAPLMGTPVRFGNLPTMFVDVEQSVRQLPNGRCAGVIRFSAWMAPIAAALDSAVDAVRHCDGVVVDLRGNPGGVGGMVMGFGGHFLDTTAVLGIMKARTNTLRFVANPRRSTRAGAAVKPFAGRLAIVTDSLSMSTSEIFAAGMQAVGRARLFGENTPGLALPAVATRLPNGDAMMHVIADFTDPTGRRIEGRGAVADVQVPLRRRDLLAGKDAPLDAALAWLAEPAARQP